MVWIAAANRQRGRRPGSGDGQHRPIRAIVWRAPYVATPDHINVGRVGRRHENRRTTVLIAETGDWRPGVSAIGRLPNISITSKQSSPVSWTYRERRTAALCIGNLQHRVSGKRVEIG